VADGPDPLGKRALFWVPGPSPEEAPSRRPGGRPDAGRRALFSASARPGRPPTGGGGRRRAEVDGVVGEPVHCGTGVAANQPAATTAGRSRGTAAIGLRCATCGAKRQVDLWTYARLHLPVFLWRPGRGFTRFMTCPACRRRAWLEVTWSPGSPG
jgi:hypothetical protein